MKFKRYTGITWSALELRGLIEDEDSRVYFEKYKKHLGLHPFHLTNLNAALNEILSSNLNFYDADLKGFLLAYKNPKLLTPFGEIFYDTCFIHVDVEADFYVFRPEIGCTLKGIVNKKGLDHVGILVHKAFNVSIPKPDNEEDWPGEYLEMGQEVRCTITLLDFTSKLPFIRGTLNPNEYLQGCKLVESNINKKRQFSADNIESNTKNSVKSVPKKQDKHKLTFFATDSENTSDEDAPHIKEEYIEEKKSKKKFKQEKSIDCNEVKVEVPKCGKKNKYRESKPKLTDIDSINDQCMGNVTTNGDLGEIVKTEKSADARSKVRKKSKAHSSQSSIDEDDNDIKSEIRLSQTPLRKTFLLDSTDGINKIEVEHELAHSDVEQFMEKSTVDSKPKIKKKSLKRKLLDDSDLSASEFTTEKYQSLNSSSKKSTKGSKTSFIKTEEIPVNIKSERCNNAHNNNVDSVGESPKKKLKKHSHAVIGEVSEGEADRTIGKSSVKKGLAFLNSVIKRESIVTDFENNHDEGPAETTNITNNISVVNNHACNSNYDTEAGDENSTPKKKRKKQQKTSFVDTSKIKIESSFEDAVIKVEKTHDGYEDKITDDIQPMKNSEDVVKTSSFRKVDGNDDREIDTKGNAKLSKRKVSKKDPSVKVKNEKSTVTDSSFVDHSDASVGTSRKKKKYYKRLNKSPKFKSDSESEFDIRNIKIKTERISDS